MNLLYFYNSSYLDNYKECMCQATEQIEQRGDPFVAKKINICLEKHSWTAENRWCTY